MHTATTSAAALLVCCGFACAPATALAAPPDDATHFEKKVRPVLVEKCVACHGPEKQKGGLRVDSRAALLQGGESGHSFVPGKPNESLLLRVLAHDGELKMPPKNKLPAAEIAALKEWVQAGAPWPDSKPAPVAVPKAGERVFTAEEKAFWAFQPVQKPKVPAVANKALAANPIDAFLLAKLSENGLSFAVPADKRTLLRRITFDLTGLPPTPAEIEAFLADDSPKVYEKVVERLLASPAYGEKWGRRWLDVARYADSNGMDENLAYVNAWRYRDYVIRSFNADKPYDLFVKEQIAGDLLAGGTEGARADQITATGFLVIGPKMLAEDDPMKMRMDILDEQLDAVGQAFMGLTLGCARCHDHKFDPITAADYYALGGMFYSTKTMKNHNVVASWNERPVPEPETAGVRAEHERKLTTARAALADAQKPGFAAVGGFGGAALAREARAKLAAAEKAKPAQPEVMAVEDAKGENLKIHLRGSHTTLGTESPRRFPRILGGDKPLDLGVARSGRLELAEWLARPEHPLTARVMVNRIWAGHFGAGLVRSTDNFGKLGDRPTHPELLDWLASEFVNAKWSVKEMHRLIVTSAAYRMSTRPDPAVAVKDPDNKLLSHFSRRRLDAEEIRDGMLAASRLLDRTAGGTLLKANPRQYVNSTGSRSYDGYATPRRSVYLPIIRSGVFNVLQTLDFPDPSVPNGQRVATTIPTQALFMLNGALVDQAAEALAKTALAAEGDDTARVREAYRRVYGRAPTTAEVEKVLSYLKKSLEPADAKRSADAQKLLAWRGLCRVLLASNEFVFVE